MRFIVLFFTAVCVLFVSKHLLDFFLMATLARLFPAVSALEIAQPPSPPQLKRKIMILVLQATISLRVFLLTFPAPCLRAFVILDK